MALRLGISNLGVNNLITHYDSIALAGVGIAKKINLTAFALTQGLSQGCLPLIGYNYSSGNKRRVRDTVIFAGSLGAVITAACMVLALFFPSALVSLFIKHPLTVSYGSEFLRIICLSMPTSTFLFMAITYFQAIGKKTFPLIISLLRKGSIDLVLMYLLDRAMGINGILWATPITETAVSVFCVVSVLIILKKEKNNRSIDN